MTITKLSILPTTRILAGAIIATALCTGAAFANQTKSTNTQAQATKASLNLLSEPRTGKPVVRVRQMGAGSWICSPAGFGQRSRCYRG